MTSLRFSFSIEKDTHGFPRVKPSRVSKFVNELATPISTAGRRFNASINDRCRRKFSWTLVKNVAFSRFTGFTTASPVVVEGKKSESRRNIRARLLSGLFRIFRKARYLARCKALYLFIYYILYKRACGSASRERERTGRNSCEIA